MRSSEDARHRPQVGDRYQYDHGAYEEVVAVEPDRVLARILPRGSPPRDVWTPLFVWSTTVSPKAVWVPVSETLGVVCE